MSLPLWPRDMTDSDFQSHVRVQVTWAGDTLCRSARAGMEAQMSAEMKDNQRNGRCAGEQVGTASRRHGQVEMAQALEPVLSGKMCGGKSWGSRHASTEMSRAAPPVATKGPAERCRV